MGNNSSLSLMDNWVSKTKIRKKNQGLIIDAPNFYILCNCFILTNGHTTAGGDFKSFRHKELLRNFPKKVPLAWRSWGRWRGRTWKPLCTCWWGSWLWSFASAGARRPVGRVFSASSTTTTQVLHFSDVLYFILCRVLNRYFTATTRAWRQCTIPMKKMLTCLTTSTSW